MKDLRPFVLCFLTLCFSGCEATDLPSDKISHFELLYVISFDIDKCGEAALGKRYREALISEIESCPLADETKLKLYKQTMLGISGSISEFNTLMISKPTSKFVPAEDAHCQQLEHTNFPLLKEKLSEYDAGQYS